MRKNAAAALAAFLALAGIAPVAAEEPVHKRTAAEVDADLLELMANKPIERFLADMLAPIRNSSEPGRLSRDEVDRREKERAAAFRATLIGEILRFDLDSDTTVTLEEVEKVGGPAVAHREPGLIDVQKEARAGELRKLFEADLNGDSKLELAEIVRFANRTPQRAAKGQDIHSLLIELDENGDGATTVQEAERRLRDVFSRFDKDGDGTIDRDGRGQMNQLLSARRKSQKAANGAARCGMPKAQPDDQIVFFSTHRSNAISTAAVPSVEAATLTSGITIEPGDGSIYLVLSTGTNMVWRIDGAVERLSKVVLLESANFPENSSVGVTGVDRSRVVWGQRDFCSARAGTAGNENGERTAAIFKAINGRPFDTYLAVATITDLSVPSMNSSGRSDRSQAVFIRDGCAYPHTDGVASRSTRNAAEDCDWMRVETKHLYPGGVVEIDPASVAALLPAEKYEVLPSPAGFMRLIEEGKIVDTSGGQGVRFKIVAPIARFPPSTPPAQSMMFELGKGVPVPAGADRRFCIFDADGILRHGRTDTCRRQH